MPKIQVKKIKILIKNKILLVKEKKKFSPEISDRLVVEVLKRKELLIDNNTSRDLQFSESKRIAWAEVIDYQKDSQQAQILKIQVKRILMQQYPSFDQEVEPIKSHWRYRKRKVTEALMDGLKQYIFFFKFITLKFFKLK